MSPLRSRDRVFRLSFFAAICFAAGGCGADTPSTFAVDAATAPDAAMPSLDARIQADMSLMSDKDGAVADAAPTTSVDATAAFNQIAGTYVARAANVSGSGLDMFETDASYMFTIDSGGTVTFSTKGLAETFTWAMHGKRIVQNTKSKITVIEMEDAGKRIVTITYSPVNGPFDVAGAIIDPQGRWYLTRIVKQ